MDRLPTTAGYSVTPLVRKLGVGPRHRVRLVAAPPHLLDLLAPLPPDVEVGADVENPDVSLVFTADRAALARSAATLWPLAFPDHAVWICWPKKRSPLFVDLTEDDIRDQVLPLGLVDNKVCAVDEHWSGLRLVVRRELRG